MGSRFELKNNPRSIGRGLFFVLFCLVFGFNAIGQEKRDTIVYRPYKDTVKLVKAQVYDIDSSTSYVFYKTRPFGFLGYVPRNLVDFCKVSTRKKNLVTVGGVAVSTAILIAFDQQILDATQQFGRYINLDSERKFKTVISINPGGFHVPVLDLPQNLNSTLYFMGEGWPSVLIAGGLWGYGSIAKDYRALQTSSQLAEMFLTLAITTQFIKRVTGRESPFVATEPGGKWRPFPNPATYQKHVPKYDAFPSGHLATAMATVTILSGNYPEERWIRPVGYTTMGLIAFSMVNNGVHWVSDYPLAIAIGYAYGKIAISHGHTVIKRKTDGTLVSGKFTPIIFGDNGVGLSYRMTF